MVEGPGVNRKFTANACLHQVFRPGRRFLRRNLRQVLDTHERILHPQTENGSDANMNLSTIARERRMPGYDPLPTPQMLRDFVRGEKPVLQIDALQIRRPEANPTKRKRETRGGHSEAPDWLPSPATGDTWPCDVRVAVLEGQNNKRSVYVEQRRATISQVRQPNEQDNYFEIVLEKPFLIELEQIHVVVENGTNGARHWKRTVDAKYGLEVFIQCCDSQSSVDLLSLLEGHGEAKYEQIPNGETALKVLWENLPECPKSGQLLPLRRRRGHDWRTLPYQLDLSLGWSRRKDADKSILQRYYQHRDKTQSTETQQLPTPVSEDMDKSMQYVIAYKFDEGFGKRVKIVEGLVCPLCRDTAKSFPRLLLHCSMFHDHFKFDEVEEDAATVSSDPTIIRKTILLGVSDKQYEKSTGQGPDERCNWIAPDRPFDMQAHNQGDSSWTQHGRTRLAKKRGRHVPPPEKEALPQPVSKPAFKRPAPDEVSELPGQGAKKHRVPDVPGVRFYHTVSKMPISPGDNIRDSDDSVDQTWLVERQQQLLGDMGMSGPAQKMLTALDRHIAREQSCSSLLMSDAIVRFARANKEESRDVNWQLAFRQKLEQLENAGIIDRATVTHCVQLMQTAPTINGAAGRDGADKPNGVSYHPNGSVDRESGKHNKANSAKQSDGEAYSSNDYARERRDKPRVKWGKGGSISYPEEQLAVKKAAQKVDNNINGRAMEEAAPNLNGVQPSKAKEKSSQHDNEPTCAAARLCICGRSAQGAKGAIICEGADCTRQDFHLSCVGLERRLLGWQCQGCAEKT